MSRLRSVRAVAMLAVSVAGLLLCACGSTTSQPSGPASPRDLPPLMVTACLDRTPSYDRQYFDAAKTLLADAVLARVTGDGKHGQQGGTVYVTLIGRNSYAPDATVRTISIPATAAPPAATSGGNVFNGGLAQQTETAVAQATAAANSQVKQQLEPDIAFLRSLNPPTQGPTDIVGCISRASERFQAAAPGTQKLLIMATDLQSEGPQQSDKSRLLTGVGVKVIEWKCDDAAVCDALRNSWQDEFLTKDQAASFSHYDPAETQAQGAATLFE